MVLGLDFEKKRLLVWRFGDVVTDRKESDNTTTFFATKMIHILSLRRAKKHHALLNVLEI